MTLDQEIKFALGDAIVQSLVQKHRAEEAERALAEMEARLASLEPAPLATDEGGEAQAAEG